MTAGKLGSPISLGAALCLSVLCHSLAFDSSRIFFRAALVSLHKLKKLAKKFLPRFPKEMQGAPMPDTF
jgi:hypothetical protein